MKGEQNKPYIVTIQNYSGGPQAWDTLKTQDLKSIKKNN